MKRTLIQLSMGACVLVALASCRSNNDGDGLFESATMMSDYTITDDMIPPWEQPLHSSLIDGGSSSQVAAGNRTPTQDRNSIPFPEGDGAGSTGSASASGRQNNKNIAKNEDIVQVDPDIMSNDGIFGTDSGAVVHTSQPKPTVKPKPATKKPTKKAPTISKPTLISYKVKKGDNLSTIARNSGTTVEAIRKASNLKSTTIYAGTTIKVPYTPKGYKAPASSKGSKGGATAKGGTYTVKSGDTLGAIAARHGISTAKLMQANGLKQADAKKLSVGRKLTIPKK